MTNLDNLKHEIGFNMSRFVYLSRNIVYNCLDKWSWIVQEYVDYLDGFIIMNNFDKFRQYSSGNKVQSV